MKLILGIVDLPYSFEVPPAARRAVARTVRGDGKDKAPKVHTAAPNGGQTTGDVATILEAEYGIYQFFFDHHQDEILGFLIDGMAASFESFIAGSHVSDDPFAEGLAKVGALFRDFLDRCEMDGQVAGVATAAAKKGVSHRFKTKKGPPRPSFIDTGLYQASFIAWVEP